MPKFGRKVPTLDVTQIPVSWSNGQVRVTRPINADTHHAPYLPNGAYWYTDGG